LQHSKNIEHVLALFNEVKGFGVVRHQKYLLAVSELESAISPHSALDSHDQNRTQAK
jgi:hypothetical protein